jgi:hypothetical protein
MKISRKLMIGVGAAAAVAAGGTGVALAVGTGGTTGAGEQDSPPVPTAAAAQAKAAALKVTGGGTVTAVEQDNEKGATYEVEVTKPDRTSVDVRLDANFALVGQPEANSGEDQQGDHQDRGDNGREQADGPETGAADGSEGASETAAN